MGRGRGLLVPCCHRYHCYFVEYFAHVLGSFGYGEYEPCSLGWSVSRVDGEHGENTVEDQLCSTLYMVKAFDMVDFFAIDEDLDGDEVVLYASLT